MLDQISHWPVPAECFLCSRVAGGGDGQMADCCAFAESPEFFPKLQKSKSGQWHSLQCCQSVLFLLQQYCPSPSYENFQSQALYTTEKSSLALQFHLFVCLLHLSPQKIILKVDVLFCREILMHVAMEQFRLSKTTT